MPPPPPPPLASCGWHLLPLLTAVEGVATLAAALLLYEADGERPKYSQYHPLYDADGHVLVDIAFPSTTGAYNGERSAFTFGLVQFAALILATLAVYYRVTVDALARRVPPGVARRRARARIARFWPWRGNGRAWRRAARGANALAAALALLAAVMVTAVASVPNTSKQYIFHQSLATVLFWATFGHMAITALPHCVLGDPCAFIAVRLALLALGIAAYFAQIAWEFTTDHEVPYAFNLSANDHAALCEYTLLTVLFSYLATHCVPLRGARVSVDVRSPAAGADDHELLGADGEADVDGDGDTDPDGLES